MDWMRERETWLDIVKLFVTSYRLVIGNGKYYIAQRNSFKWTKVTLHALLLCTSSKQHLKNFEQGPFIFHLSPWKFLFLSLSVVNFIIAKFSKHPRWKEFPRENNTKVPEVWQKNSAQTRLGSITSRCSGKEPALLPRTYERAVEIEPKTRLDGEFWASDVIMHKTYRFWVAMMLTASWCIK